MPFVERSMLSVREEFCRLALSPGANVRELCRRFGIGPTSGYKWLERFRLQGSAGLADRSRRPRLSPRRIGETMEAAVLAVRREHPAWGGRKIRHVLHQDGGAAVPSASTITQILRRHGQLDGPGAGERRDWQRFEHAAPNDLWQMDFKGHIALRQGRCHPLTVLDDHSRYALSIEAFGNEQSGTVQSGLEAVFRRYGLPWRMLADNGPPWGTAGAAHSYTRLGVWLMDLDIGLVHGRPYHPQTQGKDERFHRTLKAEVLAGRVFASLSEAQDAFDRWRPIYNGKRPHEALGMATPASRYRPSLRPMPERIDPPDYEPQALVRKVQKGGFISFKGHTMACPKAFEGRLIAACATETDGVFNLCYRHHVLAQIDLRQTTS